MKRTEISAIKIFFFIFLGHFGVKNGRRGRSVLYRGENIHDQLFVCVFLYFFDTLVIMGDTERLRNSSFRGLSVRKITALQYIIFSRKSP